MPRSGQPRVRERHGGVTRENQENMNGSWDLWLDKKGEKNDGGTQEEQQQQQSQPRQQSRWDFVDDERKKDATKGSSGYHRSDERQKSSGYHRSDERRHFPPAATPHKPYDYREPVGEEDAGSTLSSSSSSSVADDHAIAVSFGEGRVDSVDAFSSSPLGFGVIVYDLETIHDAERGTYASRGMHECSYEEQITWKMASQIIEFAAVEVCTGRQICVQSRPEFGWADVRSLAARLFAEDHGHDKIVKDESVPPFPEVWTQSILPWLQSVAGSSNSVAMIAHNGDNFDSFIMEKELTRHGLMDGLPLVKNFDPVRSLKGAFGQDFGSGGLLTLGSIHKRHVPNPKQDQPLHQAFADCVMLLECITHWVVLRSLLAAEIAASFASVDTVEDVCDTLIASLTVKEQQPVAAAVPEAHSSRPSRDPRVAGERSVPATAAVACDAAGGSAGSTEAPNPSARSKAERPEKAKRPDRSARSGAAYAAEGQPRQDLKNLSLEERRRLIRMEGQSQRAMEKERAVLNSQGQRAMKVEEVENDAEKEPNEKADWEDEARDGRSGRRRHRAGRKASGTRRRKESLERPKDGDGTSQSTREADSAPTKSSGSGVQFQ